MLKWFKDKFNKDEDKKEKEEIESEEKSIGENIEDIKDSFEKEQDKIDSETKETEENIEDIKVVIEDIKEEVDTESKSIIDSSERTKENLNKTKEEFSNIGEEVVETKEEISSIIKEDADDIKEDKETNRKGFFAKLVDGMTKTRQEMTNKIDGILSMYKKVDEELFEDLEEVLVTADVGVSTTMQLIDKLRDRVKEERVTDPKLVKNLLKEEINILMRESVESNYLNVEPSPAVMLVVGVNGVGKTTTIGKLAHRFRKEGKKVLIAAGDTFRAAAIEQIEEWGSRSNVDVISHSEGADPAAVIYDGIHAAKARKADILICDTAGRLHNKSNLMNELNKIFRIVEREYGDATREVLLVLDATTGQNAINQAKVFKEVANITGIALTKLDGTAKGGVVIALQAELGLPIKLIGVGEGIDDLQTFISEDFVEAIFN